MYVFPKRRCPDCGTIGDGWICASCHRVIWTKHFRYIDPEGDDRLAASDTFDVYWDGIYQGGKALIVYRDQDDFLTGKPRFLHDGALVQGIGWIYLDSYGGQATKADLVINATGSVDDTANPIKDTERPGSGDDEGDGPDEDALELERLAKVLGRNRTPAELVRFMIGRESATYREIRWPVHSHEVSDGAVEKNCYRTIDLLFKLRSDVLFLVSAGGFHRVRGSDYAGS